MTYIATTLDRIAIFGAGTTQAEAIEEAREGAGPGATFLTLPASPELIEALDTTPGDRIAWEVKDGRAEVVDR